MELTQTEQKMRKRKCRFLKGSSGHQWKKICIIGVSEGRERKGPEKNFLNK